MSPSSLQIIEITCAVFVDLEFGVVFLVVLSGNLSIQIACVFDLRFCGLMIVVDEKIFVANGYYALPYLYCDEYHLLTQLKLYTIDPH